MLQPGNIPDNATLAFNSSDPTKKLALSLSGITTGTTRTLTAPDANGTIVLASDLSAYGLLAGTQTWSGTNTINGPVIFGNSGYIINNATNNLRFNNSAQTLNLMILQDDGELVLYGGTSAVKARIKTATGAIASGFSGNPSAQIHIANVIGTGNSAAIFAGISGQSAALVQLHGFSSVQLREQVDLDTAWVTSTDASRKARFILRVYDTAAREVMRGEASGSAAMIGFLGAGAIVRQTVAADASDLASAITLVNDIKAKLSAAASGFGLFT